MQRYDSADRQSQELLLRLDAIVALLLDRPAQESTPSTGAKILRLINLGFSPTETSALVKKPTNYVSAVIADSRKRKAKPSKKAK